MPIINNPNQYYDYDRRYHQKTRNQSLDPDQSYHQYDRAKCSTRTNPYTNLLNSNYVGSTAPSINMDQLAASQVNNCSQFMPGNQTIRTMAANMPSNNNQTLGGANHQMMYMNSGIGMGMTHTLD